MEGPVQLLRGAQAATEMGMAELLCGFTLNGEPIVSRDYIRRWATSVAIRALQAHLTEAIAELRSLREVARRIGDNELADLATGTMTLVRLIATDDTGDVLGSETFVQIGQWAKIDVAPPRLL